MLEETVCSKSEQKALIDERYRTLPLTELLGTLVPEE